MFNPFFFCFAWTAICIFLGREGSFYGISILGLSARFVLAGHNGVPFVKGKIPPATEIAGGAISPLVDGCYRSNPFYCSNSIVCGLFGRIDLRVTQFFAVRGFEGPVIAPSIRAPDFKHGGSFHQTKVVRNANLD